jgi:hypothetical protein
MSTIQTVEIDQHTCLQTAELIRNVRLRESFYARPFLRVSAPTEIRLRGYFYAVAICHQTYHLQNKALNLFGWDYLEHVFTKLMNEQAPVLKPGHLSALPSTEVENMLASLFSLDGNAATTTLDRLPERAGMLIELDTLLDVQYQSSLSGLVEMSGNCLMNNGNGFYEVLPQLASFADPMRKKITFLLKLLEEAGMVSISDTDNFIPIMDYHMQRVLLRIGCVQVIDKILRDKLANREPLTDDIIIRSACIDAFKLIAKQSGYAITKMNDFFWSLGRSCCNEKPLCQVNHCEKDPCTFFEIVEIKEHANCYFKSCCKGYSDENFRKLWQPVVETHYY